MADDKDKTGADRLRVSASEDYEVEYLMRKHGATKEKVLAAIHSAGPMRDAVEKALAGGG